MKTTCFGCSFVRFRSVSIVRVFHAVDIRTRTIVKITWISTTYGVVQFCKSRKTPERCSEVLSHLWTVWDTEITTENRDIHEITSFEQHVRNKVSWPSIFTFTCFRSRNGTLSVVYPSKFSEKCLLSCGLFEKEYLSEVVQNCRNTVYPCTSVSGVSETLEVGWRLDERDILLQIASNQF